MLLHKHTIINFAFSKLSNAAQDIQAAYDNYDGFVIVHGTDTMSYSAAALSFILEDLGKPVIFTGAQKPMAEMRSDAIDNLQGVMKFLKLIIKFIIKEPWFLPEQ